MTGQSPARTGFTTPAGHVPQEVLEAKVQSNAPTTKRQLECSSVTRLKADYYTLAEALKHAGYATGHFGKWHVGAVKAGSPVNPHGCGFDQYLSHDNFFGLNPPLSLTGADYAP